tara:strand:+ start:81 stop:314 length:234 start_codon:yes stop_codon:yes gene_type:complete
MKKNPHGADFIEVLDLKLVLEAFHMMDRLVSVAVVQGDSLPELPTLVIVTEEPETAEEVEHTFVYQRPHGWSHKSSL